MKKCLNCVVVSLMFLVCFASVQAQSSAPPSVVFLRSDGLVNRVFRSNLDGTNVVNLTPAPDFQGAFSAAGSPDGTRVAYYTNAGVRVMNADGPNDQLAVADGQYPAWRPDGLRIAYSRFDSLNGVYSVFESDLDGGNETLLIVDAKRPRYSPDGSRIVFETDTQLQTIGIIDIATSTTTLVNDAYQPDFGENGSRVLFTRTVDAAQRIHSVDLSGGDLRVVTTDSNSLCDCYDAATDSLVMLYQSPSGVILANTDGSAARPVFSDGSVNLSPAFLGRFPIPAIEPIVYIRDGFVYTSNSDGSDASQRSLSPGASSPALSPDGTKIIFPNSGLFSFNLTTGVELQLADLTGFEASPAWSPDGTKIAFHDTSNGDLYIADADGTNRTVIVDDASDPDWASDRQRIVYRKNSGNIEIITIATADVVTLGPGNSPSFSPDGTKIAFQNNGIRIMNADGTNETVASTDTSIFEPDWSADGSRIIAYRDNGVANPQIVSFNLEGLQLSNNVGVGSQPAYRAASLDDAPNHISFSPVAYSVAENAGSVALTVVRNGNIAIPASASFTTFDGTAVAPDDYTTTAGIVEFAAGEVSKTISIDITNDAEFDPDETFTVRLTATTPTFSATDATATVTIGDSITRIDFQNDAYQIGENQVFTTLTVVRSGNTDRTSTAAISWSTATATIGEDFLDFQQTLTFAPGETTKTFDVQIVNDAIFENNENVFALLSSGDTDTEILQDFAIISILDNDHPSAYEFTSNRYDVIEGDENATVVVRRTGGEDAAGQVRFQAIQCLVNGCATANSDFSPILVNVQFAVGETQKSVLVPITNDSNTEPLEVFLATLFQIDIGSTVLPPGQAPVVITDDDINFGIFDATVTEGDAGGTASVFVTVSRSSGVIAASVDYATEDVSATSGTDYVSSAGTIEFAVGETEKQIELTINGDDDYEFNETFRVRLSNPVGGFLPTTPFSTVTIANDEPAFTLSEVNSSISYNVNEVDGSFTVRVARAANSSSKAGSVTFETVTLPGDQAQPNTDYVPFSGTLEFAAGENEKFVTVQLVDDPAIEEIETFRVRIVPTTQTGVITPTTAQINIYDRVPFVSFDPNRSYEVSETAGTFTAVITRQGNPNFAFDVDVATADGTATAGSDYTPFIQTVHFNAFEFSKNITIPIASDTQEEGVETFSIALSNLTVGTLIAPSTVEVQILEPIPQIRFVTTLPRLEERNGPIVINLQRTGTTSGTSSVNFATVAGTAAATSDFTPVSGTLTFAPGETSKTVNIPIVDNDATESTEVFQLQLSSPVGATIPVPSVSIQIDDDDSVAGLQLSGYSVNEDAANVSLTLTRSGLLSRPVTLGYRTQNSTATAGTDYVAVDSTVTFAAGQSAVSVSIPLIDDLNTEPNETFVVSLSTTAGSGVTLRSFNASTVTIVDNDPKISFSASQYSADEGQNAVLTVVRNGNSGLTASVDYQTSNGTAVSGADYPATSATLTFNAGETQKTISIPLTDDGVAEQDEYFLITLSNPNGAELQSPNIATVTINSTPARFGFVASDEATEIANCSSTCVFVDYLAIESAGSKTISVARTGDATIAASVNYATSALTATNGVDFTAAAGTLNFAPGETLKTFVVPIADDTIRENNETFRVTLSNPSAGAVLANSQRNVTIRDSFTGFISPSRNALGYVTNFGSVLLNQFSTFENAGTATITLSRVGDTSTPATVQFSTSGGTATAGVDYTSVSGSLTFSAGQRQQSFEVPITPDSDNEGDETVGVQLQYVSGETTMVNATGTLTIREAIVGFPCEGIDPCRDYHANGTTESSGFIDTPVVIQGAVSGPVVVNYATEDVTAIAGSDYVAASGQLTFDAITRRHVVRITLSDDGTYEAPENFRLRLTSVASGAAALESNPIANVTINDASVLVADAAVAENADATVVVNRIGDFKTAFTVDFATNATGTATPNVDFTPVSGTLSFAAGETSKTFTIPIVNDAVFDSGETIAVVLSNVVGEASITDGAANVTITDDSPARVAFNRTSLSVNENAATLAVGLTRTGNTSTGVAVTVRSANGSAIADDDFGAVDQTITFAPGETTKTLDVSITDDAVGESNENFTLALSLATGESTVGGPATVTIVDPTVRFRGSSFAVNENGGTATISVVLEGAPQTAVTINYATVAGGTATANVDYTPVSGQLSFAIGETTKTFDVPVAGDSSPEGIEFVNLALSGPTGETTIGTPATARLNLTETRPTVEIPGFQLQVVKSGGLLSGRHLAGIATDVSGNVFVAADDPTNTPSLAARKESKAAEPLAGTETQYFDLYRINLAGTVSFVGRYDVLHFDLVNMVFGPDGALYTAGSDAAVYRIDTATAAISMFNSNTGLSYFRAGIDFDASGNLILMTEAAPNAFYRIPSGTGSVFLGSYSLDNYGNYGTRFNVAPDGSYVIYPDGPAANNPRVTRILTTGHTPGTPFSFEYASPTNVRTLGSAFGHSFGAINPLTGGVFSSGGNFGDGSSVILYTPPGTGSALASTTVRAVSGIGNGVADGGDNLAARGVTAMTFGARRDAVPGKALYFIDDFDDTVYQLIAVTPTAANVSLSGRVLTSDGRGLSNAVVTLTKADGTVVSTRSTSFGAFLFSDLAAGETVVVSVISRKFTFTPRVVEITDDVANFDLTADSAQ